MSDMPARFDRQSRWQRSRSALSWSEKIRIVDEIREDIETLRRRAPTTVPAFESRGPAARPTRPSGSVSSE